MKKKLRLNFEQLAEEMQLDGNTLSTPEDLSLITGGSSLDEIITYFQSMGFNFTVNGSGNLYYQSSDLPDVIVTAYRDSGFNDIPWQLTGSGWLYMNGSYGLNNNYEGYGGGESGGKGNDDSNGLTPEQRWSIEHPIAALDAIENKNLVEAWTGGMHGQHNGYADAFRHALFTAMNTADFGKDLALELGVAHEDSVQGPLNERNMDLANNLWGAKYAETNVHFSFESFKIAFDKAVENGEITILDYSQANPYY